MNELEIGRLLRAGTTGFTVGSRVAQFEADTPNIGALVRAPLTDNCQAYGLIYDIHIDDDGLVRQLVTSETIDEFAIADTRVHRTVPVEISVLASGYRENNTIYHLLPPRPPLSLDVITLCSPDELRAFTLTGHFGYFRHILRAKDLPVGELLAAHLRQANEAHLAAGDSNWVEAAMQELIVLLRDDYQTLMAVLSALGDALTI